MGQESKNIISFLEALEASRKLDKYYMSGEYFEDIAELKKDQEAVEEFINFYVAVCKA